MSKISVIVPVYKVEPYLAKCVKEGEHDENCVIGRGL